jgi:hypothetical protein
MWLDIGTFGRPLGERPFSKECGKWELSKLAGGCGSNWKAP